MSPSSRYKIVSKSKSKSKIVVMALAIALSSATAATTTTFAFAAGGVAPPQATAVQREQAQARFQRGKDKLVKKDTAGALVELSASLDIIASPNTRLYVGRCLREMGRIVEAYVEFGRTEIEAKELSRDDPRYEKAGQAAHEERSKLESKLAFLNIEIAHAEENTTLKVGPDEIRRGGWNEPLPVMPGTVEVIVQTPGRDPIQRSVTTAVGEKKAVAIDAAEGAPAAVVAKPSEHTPEPTGGNGTMRNMAYVAGGAAIVGLGLFTVFGLQANSTHSKLEDECGGPCPPGHEADVSTGRTQQTVANVGLGVFLVGAAAAVTLWIVSKPSSAPASNAPTTGNAPARAAFVASPSFVGLKGAF